MTIEIRIRIVAADLIRGSIRRSLPNLTGHTSHPPKNVGEICRHELRVDRLTDTSKNITSLAEVFNC